MNAIVITLLLIFFLIILVEIEFILRWCDIMSKIYIYMILYA